VLRNVRPRQEWAASVTIARRQGSSGFVSTAKLVYGRVQHFLVSLKHVAVTTYRLARVRQKTVKTRTELEQIRENNESLLPVTLLVLCQFVPVLGNIPILGALAYPRQLLTISFWSPEQLASIREIEFKEKEAAREILVKILAGGDGANGVSDEVKALVARDQKVEELPTVHLTELAKANALYANNLIYSAVALPIFGPISVALIRKKLTKRAIEIASDDAILRNMRNEELSALTASELLTACTRRGSSPHLDKDQCLAFLTQWLSKESFKGIKCPPLLLQIHVLSLPASFA
jgi:hypothetical protein